MTKRPIRVGLLTQSEVGAGYILPLLKKLCRAARGVKVVWASNHPQELSSLDSIDLLLTTIEKGKLPAILKKGKRIPIISGPPQEIIVNFWKTVLNICRKRKASVKEKEALFQSALKFWERSLATLKLEERLAGIGQMAQRISHDLRNPLTSIMGFGQMLCSEGISSEERADCLRMIKGSSKRMLEILDEISLFVQAGKASLNLSTIKVEELLKQALAPIAEELKQKGIRLEVKVDPALEISCDPPRLSHALTNILENARDATSSGGTICLSAQGRHGQVYIAIADTGRGIEPTILSRLFEPLVSFGKSGRTGLGLAITKKIVEAHGGTIFVASTREGATTLAIILPASGGNPL